MGDLLLNCPLCCNKSFSSKELLLEHLASILDNIICPVCNSKWPSLVQLIEHLSLDNCQTVIVTETQQIADTDYTITENLETQIDDPEDPDKMYVQILDKPTDIETTDLKLVKENGETRYMIVPEEDEGSNEDNTIVTKQNTDGTISLTTVKDIKTESEGLLNAFENTTEQGHEQIYSCNTCKVSFSSVLEHIQNYHNNQDVVVEEPIEEDTNQGSYEVTFPDDNSDSSAEKQAPRRVITATGDIVEESPETFSSEEPQDSNKKVSYHKVSLKEVEGSDGTSMKLYTCVNCNVMVQDINLFRTQPCKVEETVLKYPCPQCPVAYDNSKSLCAHMKAHKAKSAITAKGKPAYECQICWTVFTTNKSLKLHKRMHDPVKAHPIELPVENLDGTEVSDERYHCPICDKMIPTEYKGIHQDSHKPDDMLNCTICNKKFSSAEYLEMHMNVHNMDKVVHNNQDKSLPYSCLYCDRKFARPHEKVKHERIHTGEKPHSCEICGKSFRVSYCLTLHMRTHTGARPYACMHCGKRFKAHSVYNHHLLIHSEVRAYKCPFCPKAFKTAVQLAGHKNSHTKPFSCQQCNRPFASLYAVRVHTETHARQNNLKFSCTLCGASYARAFALKDHVKQVHKQDIDSVDGLTPPEEMKTWLVKNNTKPSSEENQGLNKDEPLEMSELSMTANELIVP